jgi:Ricin-type beta-trefoil lectin domain/Phosphatidylinositol-specific phospholipase C, X domain
MNRNLTRLISICSAGIPLTALGAGNNWMAAANGGLNISQFSIPGTHDSGARFEPVGGTAKCQNLTIADQLNAGVRFLDVRCRHINNAFSIHHGQVYQNDNFDGVLNAAYAFLNANPTETIIMSVKEEYTPSGNTRSFEATYDSYVAANPSKWQLGSAIPTLNNSRGKIVLFRRFGAGSPKGIDASNWPDNTSFSSEERLRVQDSYNVSNNDTKWAQITANLGEALYGGPNTLYVNFSSGVQSGLFGIPNIPNVSNNINPRLTTYFNANKSGRFGAILMDFADSAKCAQIYNTNFPVDRPVSKPAYFLIVNKNSGKCLDLIGGNTGLSAVVNQYAYDYNGPNQRWTLAPTEATNHFRISSYVSGKCFSMANDSTAAGVQLQQFDYTGNNPSQQFDLIDAGNGFYKIKNVRSGLVLEIENSSTGDNAKVQQASDNNGNNQQWRLQPWGDYFARTSGGKYICINAAGSTNGSGIIQYTYENNPWFKWRFESVGNGHLRASSLNALTRVIGVIGGNSNLGEGCHLYDYNTVNAGDQKLRILPKTNGKFKFYFVHDNLSWDIPGGNAANNVRLEQYSDNGNAQQDFLLERAQ